MLYYFKNTTDKIPSGTINLDYDEVGVIFMIGCFVERIVDKESEGKYGFQITNEISTKPRLKVYHSDNTIINIWIECLLEAAGLDLLSY